MDAVAPLIDMAFKIASDIKWFVALLLIYVYAFAAMFAILAHNQVEFETVHPGSIPYWGLGGAVQYVLGICYGSADDGAFGLGTADSRAVLYLVFYVAMFCLVIHLLNLVIALMGNSYGEGAACAAQVTTRNHLSFVLENWFLMSTAARDSHEVKYIITAFLAQPDTQAVSMLSELKGEISKLSATIQESFRGVYHDNRE